MKLILTLTLTVFLAIGCASPEKSKSGRGSKSSSASSSKKSTSGKVQNAETVVCKLEKDERKISNLKGVGSGCEVEYTKWGEAKIVATADNDMSHCEQIQRRIASNLEKAGFSCD